MHYTGSQAFVTFVYLIFDKSSGCDLSVHRRAINGRTHFSFLLSKWLVFLMNTIKGKVSLPQHLLCSLRPSMSIDVFLPLIIYFLCTRSSLSTAAASQNTVSWLTFCHIWFMYWINMRYGKHMKVLQRLLLFLFNFRAKENNNILSLTRSKRKVWMVSTSSRAFLSRSLFKSYVSFSELHSRTGNQILANDHPSCCNVWSGFFFQYKHPTMSRFYSSYCWFEVMFIFFFFMAINLPI